MTTMESSLMENVRSVKLGGLKMLYALPLKLKSGSVFTYFVGSSSFGLRMELQSKAGVYILFIDV